MTGYQIQLASDMLWNTLEHGGRLSALPEDIRPRTRSDGYAIQARFEQRSARPLFGWKIAATSQAGQAHIGVDGPLAGRLLAERVFESGATLPFGSNHMRVAEAEFAFRMAVDLPPRAAAYTTDEVLASVATLHPSIEVPDSRYDDFTIVGAPQLIADNACAHYFVFGAAAPDSWRSADLVAHRVIGFVRSASLFRLRQGYGGPAEASAETGSEPGDLEREGIGANVLGDPRIALAWLVNELSGLGLAVRAGQVVTTGTCLVPLPINAGARVRCDFGEIGAVSVSFSG